MLIIGGVYWNRKWVVALRLQSFTAIFKIYTNKLLPGFVLHLCVKFLSKYTSHCEVTVALKQVPVNITTSLVTDYWPNSLFVDIALSMIHHLYVICKETLWRAIHENLCYTHWEYIVNMELFISYFKTFWKSLNIRILR